MPSLRFITSSSAPLLRRNGGASRSASAFPVAQGYGSSETAWIAVNPGRARRFGSVGRPLAYHRLAIVDTDGRAVPPGETGHVELGAWDDNDYRYLGDDGSVRVNSRGRMRTGDIGYLDADGFLYLTGREKELIIRGGVNISPVEIDGVLMQRAEISEAATIGVPDTIWGEEVVSYVVLAPRFAVRAGRADALLRRPAARPFKAPKQILLRDRLPKSERGKLDRKALVAEWMRARGDAPNSQSLSLPGLTGQSSNPCAIDVTGRILVRRRARRRKRCLSARPRQAGLIAGRVPGETVCDGVATARFSPATSPSRPCAT